MRIHYSQVGEGPALVLFHGWGFESNIWADLALELSKHYTVFSVDLPGFGFTPLMSWEQFSQGLLALLPAQFNLLGWSMGGLYATKLALSQPERVLRLINVASTPKFIESPDWPGISTEVFEGFYQRIISEPRKVLKDFIALQNRGLSTVPQVQSLPEPASLQAGLQLLKEWDLREQLHHLSMPVAYLFGRLDAITHIKTYKYMQAAYSQFDYMLFKKSAHMPFLSQASDFKQFILDFLS